MIDNAIHLIYNVYTQNGKCIARVYTMDKKQRNFRLTDGEYELVKQFIRDGFSASTPKTDESAYSPQETEFINKAIMWYRAQNMLKKVGAIQVIPNPFAQCYTGAIQNDSNNNRELKQNEFRLSRTCIFPDEILQDYAEYQQYEWVFARARQKLIDEHPDGICTYDDIRAMIDKYIKQVEN